MKLSNAGFTLIEVLVASTIMGIVAVSYGRMVVNQVEQQRALTQKFEMLDLKNQMLSAYNSPTACSCMLNPLTNTTNTTPLSWDSTQSDSSIKLNALYAGCDASLAPTNPIAKVGELLPGTGSGLKIADISVVNIQSTGSINPDEYTATFQVSFDPKTVSGSRRPITIQQRFMATSTSPPTGRTVSYCGTPGVTAFGGMFSRSISGTCVETNPITTNCSCPLGYNEQRVAANLSGSEASIYYCMQ